MNALTLANRISFLPREWLMIHSIGSGMFSIHGAVVERVSAPANHLLDCIFCLQDWLIEFAEFLC